MFPMHLAVPRCPEFTAEHTLTAQRVDLQAGWGLGCSYPPGEIQTHRSGETFTHKQSLSLVKYTYIVDTHPVLGKFCTFSLDMLALKQCSFRWVLLIHFFQDAAWSQLCQHPQVSPFMRCRRPLKTTTTLSCSRLVTVLVYCTLGATTGQLQVLHCFQ